MCCTAAEKRYGVKKAIFKKNGSYRVIFEHIQAVSDAENVNRICREANETYYEMLKAHDDLNKMAMIHWKQCCERAAFYSVVKKYYPDSVMEWLNEALKIYGENAGAKLNRLLYFPGLASLFLPVMRTLSRNAFGEKGGFKNQFGCVNKEETHFDILECPYCRYLAELGCPELNPGFCKSDEYIYGNLDAIIFERTQTLGTGGEKCDFCMRKRKAAKGK